jgi:hypothetical protein
MKTKTKTIAAALSSLALASAIGAGCRDLSGFSSHRDSFQGTVVNGSFVRSGVNEDVKLCLTLDTDHLQDAPGSLWSSDGRFSATPMRPIPQIWHDPLSTLDFGDGRLQNLIYAATPSIGDAAATEAQDIFVVVSLMQSNHIEVRLLRGAPPADASAPMPGVASTVFAVFHLEHHQGACGF